MILVDFQQVMLSKLLTQLGKHTNAPIDESMIRHMIIESLRTYKTKFSAQYGEMVICCDNKNYWRKKQFPYYKVKRREQQDKSELDWNAIYVFMAKIKQEIKENFPYPVIEVESAEADDIIATLAKTSNDKKILILSRDKDFIQLHRHPGVEQFDPIAGEWIRHNNPVLYLKEHIIRGDTGDSIPNFLSPDDAFVSDVRQKSIFKKKVDEWLFQEPSDFCDENTLKNYNRNAALIDLDNIPENIHNSILEEYQSQQGKTRKNLMNYFINNRLRNLMGSIGDF